MHGAERCHGLLKNHTDVPAPNAAQFGTVTGKLRNIRTVRIVLSFIEQDSPIHDFSGLRHDSHHRLRSNALSAAALTDQSRDLSLVHLKANSIHGPDNALVELKVNMQILDGEDRGGSDLVGLDIHEK